jgi:hypothetical protein
MTQRTNTGFLFKNKKHVEGDKTPNLKGTGCVTIEGKEYQLDLAAWTKTSENAGKFLSLSIEVKDAARGTGGPNA